MTQFEKLVLLSLGLLTLGPSGQFLIATDNIVHNLSAAAVPVSSNPVASVSSQAVLPMTDAQQKSIVDEIIKQILQ